jgi:hypothetical protein
MVVQNWNPSTQEAQEGGSRVRDKSGQGGETLFQEEINTYNEGITLSREKEWRSHLESRMLFPCLQEKVCLNETIKIKFVHILIEPSLM